MTLKKRREKLEAIRFTRGKQKKTQMAIKKKLHDFIAIFIYTNSARDVKYYINSARYIVRHDYCTQEMAKVENV